MNFIKVIIGVLALFAAHNSFADQASPTVFAQQGKIYISDNGANRTQLTKSGNDSSPVLSPNHKIVAFLRKGAQLVPKDCDILLSTNGPYGNEIWVYDLDSKSERLLVKNNFSCGVSEEKIIDPSHLQFSPDNTILYFLTSAWATSLALHAVNLDGSNLHYIIPANSIEVVMRGEYKGYLIVQQHRYFIGGGSYDWYWLFTPQGKEKDVFGDEVSESQREFINSSI
jgi:hypothetical protein